MCSYVATSLLCLVAANKMNSDGQTELFTERALYPQKFPLS